MTLLQIKHIRLDGGTQTRSATNQAAVEDYAAAMKAGDAFPPVVVFHDGKAYWLADGFHRVQGAILAGEEEISADIRPGTQRDARLFAVGANQTHGLRRSNEDKRRAVLALLEDAEWCTWSDREISRHTGTSHTLVAQLRAGGNIATVPKRPKSDTASMQTPVTEHQVDESIQRSTKAAAAPKAPYLEPKADPSACPNCKGLREELNELISESQAFNDEFQAMVRVLDAEDHLAQLRAEVKRFSEMNRVLTERLAGKMSEAHALAADAKRWMNKFLKLEKQMKALDKNEAFSQAAGQ
jgi:hypothetical protein